MSEEFQRIKDAYTLYESGKKRRNQDLQNLRINRIKKNRRLEIKEIEK